MSKALVPQDEKDVLFYDDTLTAALIITPSGERKIYVPVKPIADALGLSWAGQYERIQRDEVLATETELIRVTRINSRAGNPDVICLPLELIPGWLFGINVSRVKSEMKDKIIRYRRECYKVLYEAFQEGRLTNLDNSIDELLNSDSPAAEAYKMAQAIMKLARHQLLLESQLKTQQEDIIDHTERIEKIEALLGNKDRHITEAQASQISQAVKAVAMQVSKKTGRNEYGAVYGELYRQFSITSYKLLPAHLFDKAMRFLNNWYQELTDESFPF